MTKEEREWAERFEQLREEFWERYRQARQNRHPTPFSWAAGLDLEHWEEYRALSDIGTNAQRIEEAIAKFLDKFDPEGCPWRSDAL